MQPAISCCPQIPIYIKNTFNPNFPGSRIYTTSTTQKDGENVICAFSSIEHMAIVNVEGSGLIGVPGVAKRLFGTLERVGVNVVLISQASSEHSITFATTEAQAELAKEVIEEEFRRELEQNRISNVDITSPCSIIAAVGDGMSQTTGVSGRFFSALGDAKINIIAIAQGCSERNISAVVRGEDSTRALRAVHAAFRLSNTAIRIAIVGMSELGESLLYLLETQRKFIQKTFDLDLQVCVVLPKTDVNEIVCLKNDTDSDASAESITLGALKKSMTANDHHASFQDERNTASKESGGPESLLKHLFRSNCTNHVIFDCTNDETVGAFHAEWIRAQVDVVTANNTGLSGSKEQRKAIAESERAYGKQSAMYLREVCVGGGLPVIKTLRSLLTSGDSIQRVDGILSVSLSYIMFRVSPPPAVSPHCRNFDDKYNNGAFTVDKPCLFSEAVRDAIQLGLMEKDPTKDLNNEYTSRVLMVLGKELGMCDDMDFSDIQEKSDKLLDEIMHEKVDCRNLPVNIDEEVKARCDAARSRGCVLRHISSVDVKEKSVDIKLVEVPENHAFAVTPPSCEIVRFFTHRHMRYPLIIQGPSAGADSTASALLAELLQLMRGKVFPRSVALTRTASGAVLQQ
jgi:aspartokinase/homoserine dehydrogenase 1